MHGLELTGRYALITVSDTGSGMDEQTRERIFEPFFTTKELGKGTGLGLSIVYGIVKQHHGQVSVYSEPGRGTTFRIYLPLTQDAVAEQSVAAPAAGARRHGDGAAGRGQRRTCGPSRAASSRRPATGSSRRRTARRRCACSPSTRDAIGLCLFDVVMPHMSGKEALDEIRARHPGARAIFMSGYAADILADPKGGGPGVVVLAKPLLPRELLRQVREALDA